MHTEDQDLGAELAPGSGLWERVGGGADAMATASALGGQTTAWSALGWVMARPIAVALEGMGAFRSAEMIGAWIGSGIFGGAMLGD